MSINLAKHAIKQGKSKANGGLAAQQQRQPKERVMLKTAGDEQKWRLGKLMANPKRPAPMPSLQNAANSGGPPVPREVNKNRHGSIAAASSGDFHVYRHDRRREIARQAYHEKVDKDSAADAKFEARVVANRAKEEEATRKRRAKRQRAKQNKAAAKRKREAEAETKAIFAAAGSGGGGGGGDGTDRERTGAPHAPSSIEAVLGTCTTAHALGRPLTEADVLGIIEGPK